MIVRYDDKIATRIATRKESARRMKLQTVMAHSS